MQNASFLISKKEKTLFSFNLNEKATYVLKSSDSLITTNTQYKKPYIFNKTLFAAQSLQGAVSTLAGGDFGYNDGTGTAARFLWPGQIAVDAAKNTYVADNGNHRIRKITPEGVVTTLAGNGTTTSTDGTGTGASFNRPIAIAIDPSGLNLYVGEFSGNKVRKIVIATGVVTTIAGSGASGNADNATGTLATFNGIKGLTVDATHIYVSDELNHNIRKIEIATGIVTTFAGAIAASPSAGYTDDTGTAAEFNSPFGITADGSGNIYVAESGGNRIRKITSAGVVTTLAGSNSGTTGTSGTTDGTGTNARFNNPKDISIDSYGDLFITDTGNNLIRKVTTGGVVTTFAGQTTSGTTNANGTDAQFKFPFSIAIDASDTFYIVDNNNHRVRKMNTSSIVTTTAASSIADKSVTLAGNAVEVVDGQTITARGIVYSITATNSNPTIGGTGVSQVTKGSGTGTFSENVTGLTANTAYTYRAYVTDSKQGTSCGPIQTFTTLKTTNSFSGASGSWSTDGNWSEGTAPTSEQHVSIPTGKTVQLM